MRPYGTIPRDSDNPHLRKGDYGRYGKAKTHANSLIRSERAIKRRERRKSQVAIKSELSEL